MPVQVGNMIGIVRGQRDALLNSFNHSCNRILPRGWLFFIDSPCVIYFYFAFTRDFGWRSTLGHSHPHSAIRLISNFIGINWPIGYGNYKIQDFGDLLFAERGSSKLYVSKKKSNNTETDI